MSGYKDIFKSIKQTVDAKLRLQVEISKDIIIREERKFDILEEA